jgi:hypothetical protein
MFFFTLYQKFFFIIFHVYFLFLPEIQSMFAKCLIFDYIGITWMNRIIFLVSILFIFFFFKEWFAFMRPYLKDFWPWKFFFNK